MNELIEKLKDKNYVRAFGLMSPEEQDVYRKADAENCLVYIMLGGITRWQECSLVFDHSATYAIKPDYQPEFEFVDLEIKEENAGYLFVRYDNNLPYCFSHNNDILPIHCLPSLPNFHCFWENEGQGFMLKNAFWIYGLVSPKVAEGKIIYARFRK